MNTVMIIPTGIGCVIGGHAGDANPAAKLLASVSDTLILHPNVVNASDINEMTENSLYVDGYMIDKLLSGAIGLKRVKSNKILVALNNPVLNETINAISAARATLGADISYMRLNTPLIMKAYIKEGKATGEVSGVNEMADQLRGYDYDALAIMTEIKVDKEVSDNYFKNGGINPWGGIEAKTSRMASALVRKPVAHAPVDTTLIIGNGAIVDPRMAAEMVSVCYSHCILKGLFKAPQYGSEIMMNDIDCLVSPMCTGVPHAYCQSNNIPIIFVKDNVTYSAGEMKHYKDNVYYVDNYLEAAGLISAMKIGITRESVSRPLEYTKEEMEA